ncbi:MAG: extracellular solute-binding protein [Clostridiales bacterium]|nr:extracellular solute-binding protein [Clostridiales bacterium]
MKRITRSTLAFLLTANIVMSLTACGKKKGTDDQGAVSGTDAEGNPVVYQLSDTKSGHIIEASDPYYNINRSEIKINKPEDKEIYYSYINSHVVVGDRILCSIFAEYVKPDDVQKELDSLDYNDPEQSQRMMDIWYEYSGNSMQLFDLEGNYIADLDMPSDVDFIGAYSGNDGEILVVGSKFNYGDCTAKPLLFVISPSGEKLRDIPLNVSSDLLSDVRVYATAEGNYLLACTGRFYLLDSEGNVIHEEVNSGLCCTMYCSGGKWYALVPEFTGNGEEAYVQEIDTETGALVGDRIKSDNVIFQVVQGDRDCFLLNANGIERFDIESQTKIPVLAWKDTDVNSATLSIDGGRIASENDMVFFQTVYEEDATYADMDKKGSVKTTLFAVHLSRADSNPHVGKKVLKLGLNGYDEPDFIEAVLQYNMDPNNSARIEIHDYNADVTNYDAFGPRDPNSGAGVDQLTLDMLSGNGPDILVGFSGLSQFNSDTMLIDLNTLIDGDSSFSRSEYFDNVFRAFETNGKLYTIPVTFSVTGMAANTDYTNATGNLTFSDFDAMAGAIPQTMQMLSADSCEDLLRDWMPHLSSHFIDYENKTVNFESEEFKTLLEMVKKYGEAGRNANSGDPMKDGYLTPNDDIMLTQGLIGTALVDFSDLQFYATIVQQMHNAGVTFSGVPSQNGIGMSVKGHLSMAITSTSADPELAWDFIRSLLSEDAQQTMSFNSNYLPVNRNAFLENCRREIESNENYLKELEEMSQIDSAKTGDLSRYTRLSDETTEDLSALISSVTQAEAIDTDILNIILEEAAGYFAGQRSVDDICANIQNRATTIMNER